MTYQTFSKLQFGLLLKNSLQSIHVDLRDTSAEKKPFVSVNNTRFVFLFRKTSNIQSERKTRDKNVASRQLKIAYYKGTGRQRRRRFGAIAKGFGRTTIRYLGKDVVPASKLVGAD